MRSRRWIANLLSSIAFASAAIVDTNAIAQDHAAEKIAIHAGTLIDVEASKTLNNQWILVDGDRIVGIQSQAPNGRRVIDWSAYTVLPGLTDTHTHLIGDDESANIAAPLMSTGARDVLLGVKNARATLMAGFTSVRDIGCFRAFTDVALRNAINDGIVIGPRMSVAGAYITVSGGGGEVTGMAPDVGIPEDMRRGVANNESEVRQRVREILAGGADFIKVIGTGAVLAAGTAPGAEEFSESEIHAAVTEAAKHGTYVAVHAHGADGVKDAIRAGARSIEHASLMDDEGVALMKKYGTYLSADIYNGDYISEIGKRDGWSAEILKKNDDTTETQRVAFRKAAKAGVKIVFGTDAGVYPHGTNANQFPYMVKYGLTPMQAIQAATINAAQLIGWDKDLGSIKVGKYADIIAVQGDPLAHIELLKDVKAVMKGGVVVKSP
jgi:imidazolonepropionase-like amidohydrolase